MNFSDPKQQWGGAVQFPTQAQVGSAMAQYSPAMAAVVCPPKMENARLKASKEYYEAQKKASLDSWSDTATLVDCYGNGVVWRTIWLLSFYTLTLSRLSFRRPEPRCPGSITCPDPKTLKYWIDINDISTYTL
ncbi:hypothetical protein M422DRAFT_259974 [Sphaerobolus stellatus SS14]|uniref:Uncharacterized protein n=1 Tax=Sphaerobolus stellatus (strain SS14) TaxID=990650 RepID=A0A0C9VJ42_SPHS4|nr:hypothetical protein M422DRAFT_259974 [Sphaerobolus stellatus SS14]